MRLRHLLSRELRRVREAWFFYRNETLLLNHPVRGHFYSPLPDVNEGAAHSEATEGLSPLDGLPGIDLRLVAQRELLEQICQLYGDFIWESAPLPNRRFSLDQGYYKEADSIVLYALLRLKHPKRVVEVGSGHSSALMLDVNDAFLRGQTDFTFIDPFPERLELVLKAEDRSAVSILRQRVQDVPLDIFKSLESGDFLFIDSSHVSKAGSDLNYLLFHVVPLLQQGVVIHFHDIYWPFEYPAVAIREGQAWSEAYLLRAFLLFNKDFEMVFWVPLAARLWRPVIEAAMPAYLRNTGASLWLRKAE